MFLYKPLNSRYLKLSLSLCLYKLLSKYIHTQIWQCLPAHVWQLGQCLLHFNASNFPINVFSCAKFHTLPIKQIGHGQQLYRFICVTSLCKQIYLNCTIFRCRISCYDTWSVIVHFNIIIAMLRTQTEIRQAEKTVQSSLVHCQILNNDCF